jgi:hypothetical protein
VSKKVQRILFAGVIAAVLAASTGVYAASHGTAARGGIPAAAGRSGKGVTAAACKTPKTNFITNDVTGLSTTSTSYVNVPGMSTNVKVGGTTASCIVVDVTGFSFATNGALEFVRALLDGVTSPTPTETQFSGDDDENTNGEWARAQAGNFAFLNVAPGTHSVAIQFKSYDGQTVFLHRPAAIITHG